MYGTTSNKLTLWKRISKLGDTKIVEFIDGLSDNTYLSNGTDYVLVLELSEDGVKSTISEIIRIENYINSGIVFLEKGKIKSGDIRGSGWKHINEEIKPSGVTRVQDLINAGIMSSSEDAIEKIFNIIKTGTSKPAIPSGTIFYKTINNKIIEIVVGDNGYIVTITFG